VHVAYRERNPTLAAGDLLPTRREAVFQQHALKYDVGLGDNRW